MIVNDNCIGCGACQSVCSDIIIDDKAILPEVIENEEDLIAICPMCAIEKE